MQRRVGNRVWTELIELAAGFIACETGQRRDILKWEIVVSLANPYGVDVPSPPWQPSSNMRP
jgi:hypothetical protein